jgi:hypothetical protein
MGLLTGVSFDHLKKQPRELVLSGCYVRSEKEVVLILQHAGEDNVGWINAKRIADAEKPLDERSPREVFAALLPAFAEHVVIGWREVNDSNGAPATYKRTDLIELMQAYASQAIDLAIRPMYWAGNANNFRDLKPKVDPAALGKE